MKLNRVLKRTAQTVTLGFLVLLAVILGQGNHGRGFAGALQPHHQYVDRRRCIQIKTGITGIQQL